MHDHRGLSATQAVALWARRTPEAIAVTEGPRRHSYAQAEGHLARIAKSLAAAGVAPGMIVGVSFAGRYMHLLLLLACEALGATHLSLGVAELNAASPAARRCGIFLTEQHGPDLSTLAKVVTIDAAFVEQAMAADLLPEDLERLEARQDPDAGVCIVSSSGTTGEPKRMLRTRRMIDSLLWRYDGLLGRPSGLEFFYCLYGPALDPCYREIVLALKRGCTVCFIDMAGFIGNEAPRSSYAILLPKEAVNILQTLEQRQSRLNMNYVRIVGSGLTDDFCEALKRSLSDCIVNIYSSNEAGMIASRKRVNLYDLAPGVAVQIVDSAGRALGLGEPGRIRVRTPDGVEGYLWDDAQTARHFVDGWFEINDVGFQPAPGQLLVLARTDDMLNIGGEKISPYPIEHALCAIDGVRDAVVLSVENDLGVGALCVVIEPEPDFSEQAVLAEVARIMSPLKRAFGLRFERSLPRTETGKVQRNLMQARQRAEVPGAP